jgi:hypothetical protein
MEVIFVHCEAYECKNITSKSYKENFGSFCFEHSSKTKGPFHIESSTEKVSPVSPRRTPLEVDTQAATSPQRKSAISPRRTNTLMSKKTRTPNRLPLPDEDEYNEKTTSPLEVETYSRSVVSPRKNMDFFPKINCFFCKNKCSISDIMECGDMFCQDCLNDEGKMNSIYCPNCNELLKGKLITEEMSKILEDRYKRKLQYQESEDNEEDYNEEDYNEEDYNEEDYNEE